jgi:hypothetical protein
MVKNKRSISVVKRQIKQRSRRDITDPRTYEIAERFNSYQRKTAENIIEMGRIVIEAKSRSESEFDDFCSLIGYDSSSSTIRKLATIGQKYEYLISRSDKLPPNWTVIYDIARLGEETIEGYINNNQISSRSSGSYIEKLLARHNLKTRNSRGRSKLPANQNVQNGTPEQLHFSAKVKKLTLKTNLIELESLLQTLVKMGFLLTVSDSLRAAINRSKTYEMMEAA